MVFQVQEAEKETHLPHLYEGPNAIHFASSGFWQTQQKFCIVATARIANWPIVERAV